LAVTGVVAIGIAVAGERILGLVGAGGLAPYVWLVPIGLLGAGAYQVLSAYAIRLGAVRSLASTKVTQGIALVVTQVVLGYVGAGAVGLMIGDAIGKSAGSGLLARLVTRFERASVRAAWARLGAVLARYRRFPLLSTGSALLNSIGLAAPAVMLLGGYGPQEAGWYALAMRALGVPIALLGNSFSQVYTSTAAASLRDGRTSLAPLYAQTARRLFLIAAPIAALVVWLGPDVFAFAFSEVWRPAGEFSRALAPMFAIQLVATPLSQTLNLLEKQRTQLIWDGLRLAVVVAVLAWAIGTGRPASTAITGLSIGMGATYVLLFALGWAAVRNRRRAP
jgi:O-antigen/teichoic acid export membrane protein